jgi:ABC transporter, substrate-binding protein, thiB family
MLTGHVLTRRGVIGGALALASAATLAACGQDTKADAKKVTLVTHSSFQVSDNLKKEFEKTSGFKLEIVDGGDGGELVNKLILSKDAPQGDVCFGVDNTYASRLLSQGVIDKDRTVDTIPESAEKYLVDNNRALVPIDMGDVAINIDKTYFTSHNLAEPKTFEDLAKPEYAKLLVAINPTTSTPGLAWMLATVGHFGADKFSDYWKTLVKGGAKIASGWTEAYNTDFSAGEGKGAYPIVVSYASSPSYTVSKDGTSTTTAALLDTAFRQVEYAGVLKGAANPAGGQAFINWMLSKAVQADIPKKMYMYPVDSSVQLPEVLAKFGPLAEKPVEVAPNKIAAEREQWLKLWASAVGK